MQSTSSALKVQLEHDMTIHSPSRGSPSETIDSSVTAALNHIQYIQYTSARQPSRMCNADSGCLRIVIILSILNFDCVCHGVRCSIVQCSAHMPRITRCDGAATEFDEGIMLIQRSTESSFLVRDLPAGRWQDTRRLLPAAAESAYL